MRGIVFFCLLICMFFTNFAQIYQANWTSLDSRPLPLWYDQAKFGIFCHWGVYSVPGYGTEWVWFKWKGGNETSNVTAAEIDQFMASHYRPNTTYPDFAAQFTVLDFNATKFAEIIKSSGAKYFVQTSKHHEGYTLWPSEAAWNWNAKDVGPAKDLLNEIREAILAVGGVHWGAYYSLLEWFHPYFLSDKKTHKQDYVNTVSYPQILDLITNYKPDILWADGDWSFNYSYWKSEEILAWLYNESPVKDTIVTNDRWGEGTRCTHGGYYTCHDKYDPGKLLPHKWEDANTVDKRSWGYRRNMVLKDVNTIEEIVGQLVSAISTGGNYLLNIGPDHNGRVDPIFEERLQEIGVFVNAHSEAIFATKPWVWQNDTKEGNIWYTSQVRNNATLDPYRLYNNQTENNTIIYAFVLNWPNDNLVNLYHVLPTSKTIVNLFGTTKFLPLTYTQPFFLHGGIQVDITGVSMTKFPSTTGFVFKIEYAADQNVILYRYL